VIELTKGDMTIRCETEAELRIARAVFSEPDEVTEMGEIESLAIGVGYLGEYDPQLSTLPDGDYRSSRHLAVVSEPETESDDSVPKDTTVQHVPVSRRNLDVLEAVMLFPEGVPASGLGTLLGLTSHTVHGRLQSLKRAGLVEGVPGHELWRATPLARRSKLVAS
jgi:hypothetical protein